MCPMLWAPWTGVPACSQGSTCGRAPDRLPKRVPTALHSKLNLGGDDHRVVERQRGYPDSRPRVRPGVGAEKVDQQLGYRVQHQRGLRIARVGVDIAEEHEPSRDPVQVADRLLE